MFRPNKQLGAIIAFYRKARELSQIQLAKIAGVGDQSVVSRWERGVTRPDPETLVTLVRELGIPPRALIAEDVLAGIDQKTALPERLAEKLIVLSKEAARLSTVTERLLSLNRDVEERRLTAEEACRRALRMRDEELSFEDEKKIGQWYAEHCQTQESESRADRENPATR